jgi:hypothetical protein
MDGRSPCYASRRLVGKIERPWRLPPIADGLLSRNLTDNPSERNELHVESGGLFSDSL